MKSSGFTSDILSNEKRIQNKSDNQHHRTLTEQEIWIDFKKGSDLALSHLYKKYVNPLYNYGCQFAMNDELVRDAVQDLFMDLIRNRTHLSDVQSVKFYLFVSLRRKLHRILKHEDKYPSEAFDNQDEIKFGIICSHDTKMINDLLTDEKCRIINQALHKLTEKQREAIMLFFYEDFSYKQVAKIMGFSKVKSVRVLIYRTIATLQAYLKNAKSSLRTNSEDV